MSTPLPPKSLTPPLPRNETERLAALHRYKILDTPPEAAFDRVTRLAARLFNMPITLISLVDESRAWFKSCVGFGASEVPRDNTLCSFAVLTDEPLIIPDTRLDDRFVCNPFVQAEPGVRFYAGAPLLSPDGFNLGTLCLLDSQPRAPLTLEQQATLVDLAAMVVDELELRLAAHKIAQSEEKYRTLFESIDEGFCTVEVLFDADGKPFDHRILQANPAFERQSGIANPEGKTVSELALGLEQDWNDLCAQVIHTGEPSRTEVRSDALNCWFDVLVSRVGGAALRQVAIVFTDISDRKRAEATLQQTSTELERQLRKFDAIAASVPDFIYTFDLSGRFTYISQSLLNLWQKTAAEAMGKNFFELDYPEALAARLQNQIQQVIETRQPLKDETPYTSAFGTRAYEYIFVPMFDATGAVEAVAGVTRDITDRKQAEAILQQTSAELESQVRKFDATLSTITDCVFSFDCDGRFLYANQVLLDLWGVTAAEAIGKTMADLNYPADVEQQVLDDLQQVLETGKSVRNETPYTNPAGVEGYFEYILSPVFAADLTVESVVGLSRDVSDRKRAEAALRHAADFNMFRISVSDALRPLIDPIEVQATASRLLGEYLGANRVAYFEVRGADYFVEQDYVNGAAPLAGGYPIDSFGPKLLAAYRTGCTVFTSDVETDSNLSLDQQLAYAAIQIRAYIGIPLVKGGELVAGLAVHMAEPRSWTQEEVSLAEEVAERTWAAVERARAEAALRQSEEKSRNILESIAESFFALDQDWRFTYMNQSAEALLDRAPGDLIGKNIWDEYPGLAGNELESVYRGAMHDRMAMSRTAFYPDHDRWYEVRTYPAANGIAVYFNNVTDRKAAEAEREKLLQQEQAAREEAQRANRIKDEFLAVLSHELRSPLNPILGWTRLLQSRKLDEPRQREALATIERNAKLQTQLIEDLLDISRIMQGKLSLTVTPVSLAFVITAAVETVRLAAEVKNIQILLDLPDAITPVSGDAARLQQVIWNLLTNAVKFTPSGGQVTIELQQLDQFAQIQVTDTGKGVDSQFLPHVFEYFRQADATTTRKFGGLGLGLAIVRQIVEMHGGTVWAESQGENRGATFTVQLPLNLQARASELEPPRDSVTTEAPLSNLQILLVDDDMDTREFQAFLLEQSGARVTAVASGFEALQALDLFIPDVLVSDVGMAEMDGYMLIRQIRSRPHNKGGKLPAIALTAYARDTDQQQVLQAGFQQHLAKPVEPEVLVGEIAKLLKHN